MLSRVKAYQNKLGDLWVFAAMTGLITIYGISELPLSRWVALFAAVPIVLGWGLRARRRWITKAMELTVERDRLQAELSNQQVNIQKPAAPARAQPNQALLHLQRENRLLRQALNNTMREQQRNEIQAFDALMSARSRETNHTHKQG